MILWNLARGGKGAELNNRFRMDLAAALPALRAAASDPSDVELASNQLHRHPQIPASSSGSRRQNFCVQKHDATRLRVHEQRRGCRSPSSRLSRISVPRIKPFDVHCTNFWIARPGAGRRRVRLAVIKKRVSSPSERDMHIKHAAPRRAISFAGRGS